jgi:hypothetical protein
MAGETMAEANPPAAMPRTMSRRDEGVSWVMSMDFVL